MLLGNFDNTQGGKDMTRMAIALLGTAFALGLSGTAYAQSSMDPATMTCADLSALGDTELQSALDMVASSAAITGTTSTSAPSTSTTTESSGSAGSGATGTGTTAGTSTGTTSGSSDSTATAGTSTGTAGTSGDTAAAGATTGTTGTSESGSSDMAAGSVDQMQIDAITAACADSPERLVSDIYRENAGANQ
jgi:hypothetical protein